MPWSKKISLQTLILGGQQMKELMGRRGVYILTGNDNQIIYIGSACKEQFGGRIIKHCVKFLEWSVGGIVVPQRWKFFLSDRQSNLEGLAVRVFPLDSNDAAKGAEAYLIKRFHEMMNGDRPKLNGRCPKYPHYEVELPAEMQ